MDTSKIIKGVVNSGRYTVTAPIVKEDYGLYLQIEGVELPPTYQVDFSNSEQNGTSVTMIGNSDGVLIPHQFIDTGKDIFAFLYHVGEDYGRTVYKFRIPNKVRPDRTEETPTPEEQSTIDQLISALNSAVEQTGEDVESASQSAQSAESAKTAAESARDTAGEYANDAESSAASASTSASQASTSATASAQSASQSAQIKSDVEGMVSDAQGYAESASQSASASAQSASDAQGYAQSASTSETNAQGYASQAQTSANTASGKAQDASTSAQTASQKATEASQSASQALSYKTDAESAKTASQTAQGLAESARDSAITAKNDAESARDDAVQAKTDVQNIADGIDTRLVDVESALIDKAPIITDTASGAIASFSDGADDLPLKSLVVDINPIQDLSHGDPSPENICPISGWTQVDVEQSGRNLFDNGMTLEDGYISPDTGQVTASQNAYNKHTPLIPIAPSISLVANKVQALTANNSLKTFFAGWAYYDINKNFISGKWNPSAIDTPPTNARFLALSVTGSATNNAYFTPEAIADFVKDYCLAYGSTATPYSPYTGRSITINLGQTVYGGKLDVLSGELTVYPYYASYNGETLTGEWISDRDKYVSGTAPTIGAQVVNIGAQGVTVQLEPHEVESLYGVNNIWADSGDTSAEYRADTKLFIERLTAPDSADMIADANIQSGKYFMVGNSLYKATANIANGAQIVVGTNCIRKSLSEALNEINA